MRLAGVILSVLLTGVALTSAGKPERHLFKHVHSGDALILHCNMDGFDSDSKHMTVEWMWKLNGVELVVMTVRDGEELVREKNKKYANRSSALRDGTMKLIGVTQQDAGDYRCIRRSTHLQKDLLVSVTVCDPSTVDMGVLRAPENDLIVNCASTGWTPKTQIMLLDHQGGVLTKQMEEGIGSDGCLSVSVSLNLTTHGTFRNGTIVCHVTSPTLVKTNQITFTDELKQDIQHLAGIDMSTIAIIAVAILPCLVVAWVQRRSLWDFLQRIRTFLTEMLLREDAADEERERLLDDVEKGYEDISDIPTSGASLDNALAKGLCTEGPCWGVPVSERLAEQDLEAMQQFKEDIMHVGEALNVAPSLIAGIISRQSNAGTHLANGFGLTDDNCYGLMQFNRFYQSVSSGPRSRDHIRQGVALFIQLLKTMWRERRNWTREQWLKGALASYIIGEDKVLSLRPSEDVDKHTPFGDFANDVIARAHFYARNGFPNIDYLPI